ncbi:hypothetical protein BV22DRAFT_1028029 [Leucogyrophana mollusca]|uniref:Uncharacterized protein n=1 Tax=Leucogyrophana mollusca TaxID=85980 RepID=A0ACB8C188_9AGAM|nr:hypothetical protein BV22DRAFT_1028029 [Leucogyrophana mollusca]
MSNFSIYTRRLASKLPAAYRQVELSSPLYTSQAFCSPDCRTLHHLVTYDGSNFTMVDFPCNYSLTPAEQVLHPSSYPAQPLCHEQKRAMYGNTSHIWNWPSVISLDTSSPFHPPTSHMNACYEENYATAPPAVDSIPAYPDGVNTTSRLNTSSDFGAGEEPLHLPRRLSYPQTLCSSTSFCSSSPSASSISVTSRARSSMPSFDTVSDHLTSPLIIKPTPVYPVTYTHSGATLNISSTSPS